MEQRAQEVGKAGELYYISPNNNQWLKPADAARAEALGLKDHILEDFHVGAGGAVEIAEKMFVANQSEGMLNLETNDGHHEMKRALAEATDLNDFFTQHVPATSADSIGRIKARTASFCTERSGHFDGFDQGISFFLPNGSWIQPPGYVHKMIHETWLPDALELDVPSGLSGSAQQAADGSQLRVMLVNSQKDAVSLVVQIQGMKTSPSATVTVLTATDLGAANPPGAPTLVSPTTRTVTLGSGGTLSLPGYSFTIAQFNATKP